MAGCLFKSKDTHVISLKEKDFKEEDILNWEKLYFLIDTENQLFVCELKQNIATPSTIRNRLYDLTSKYYKKSGYTLKLEYRKEEKAFWSLLKGTDKIFEIGFTLHAPNLFGYSKEATGFLNEVKEKFNINSIDVGLNNSNGTLTYDEGEIEPLRDYADSGGGKWTIKILEDGEKKRHNSDSYFKSIEADIEEDLEASIEQNVEKAIEKLKQAASILRNEVNS